MLYKSLCALLLLPALAGCASGSRGEIYNRPLSANPSAFIAADIGLARLVQEKGQMAAFRELAHEEAVVFTPGPRPARDWLRAQAEPAERMRWQPHGVVISCDGNIGVTRGSWQVGSQQGHYATLWQRDEKGRLHWRVDERVATGSAPEAPEYISTRQASCSPKAPSDAARGADGSALDHSLSWTIGRNENGAGHLAVSLWDGKNIVPLTMGPTGAAPE